MSDLREHIARMERLQAMRERGYKRRGYVLIAIGILFLIKAVISVYRIWSGT